MLKKKELSKKKNLLMVLWDDSIAFRVETVSSFV